MWSFISRILLIFGCLLPGVVSATSLGQVANNLMAPVFILTNFIASISLTIGISFIFASVIKYMQYRVNPLAVPISTVILLLIMGIVLVCLPWMYKLTGSGVPIQF